MNRALYLLLGAQFLTAFADNAILFTAIAMIEGNDNIGDWYKPALQASFLVAFVVLAPWVGRVADAMAKSRVLTLGNALKAVGALLLIFGMEPIVAYAVVGIGAAVYGPAKYGILPELVVHDRLVRANGLIEGSTIVAIILGAVVGGRLAGHSIFLALVAILVAYLISLGVSLFIPMTSGKRAADRPALPEFMHMMRGFFSTTRARFSVLGSSVFWAAAAVLRIMLLEWAPVVLLTASIADRADLTVFVAIGIAAGAVVVPWLVPIERLRRARLAAYVMGALIVLLAGVTETWAAELTLVAIGMAGGIFVVPINAALQEIGHKSIGSGGAVAIQNFFENLGMLIGTGLWTIALAYGADPVLSVMVLGLLVVAATFIVSRHLPQDPVEEGVSERAADEAA